MAKKKVAPIESPKNNKDRVKTDPLVGLDFTFSLDNKTHFGNVEAKISPGVYFVRVKPDDYGYVLSAAKMYALNVVFESQQK
jgi:hypothetical protein